MTTLVRWNPWSDLFTLRSQVDDLFQSLTPTTGGETFDRGFTRLPVDIRQTESEFVIEASVPGFKPDEVEVTFDDGDLTIKGARSTEDETRDGDWIRRERRATSVFRRVALPDEVRADEISAIFDNGVLRIAVPRAQRAQPKRIPVTSGNGGQPQVVEHDSNS